MTLVLTTDEMAAADRAAIESGIDGSRLMDAAGWQVARLIRQHYIPRKTLILCGPGNNGGDGFVIARLLRRWGWPVSVALLGDPLRLRGDAAIMAERWRGPINPASPHCLEEGALIVDALFGAGLARPLDGMARQIVTTMAERGFETIAVDLPSGVNGDSGAVMGAAAKAAMTVTFAAPKPGHLLLPGRLLCGRLEVTDIGLTLPASCSIFHNEPGLWRHLLPKPQPNGHKFDRGHLLVAGGATFTGAARLAAAAGRRSGAGLVTIAAPAAAESIYRMDRPGTMVRPLAQWPELLADKRVTAAIVGPGLDEDETARRLTLQALAAGKACVLDAGALSAFAADPGALWQAGGMPVLTPHDGEFARLFHDHGDRLTRARRAARESGAIMLLKGADCVVAAPDGRAAIADNAPPSLATAGAGDVLAGLLGGLLAQGMDRFFAACAAVWLHGEAAAAFGPGLIAEDLIDYLPNVLATLSGDDG